MHTGFPTTCLRRAAAVLGLSVGLLSGNASSDSPPVEWDPGCALPSSTIGNPAEACLTCAEPTCACPFGLAVSELTRDAGRRLG